jgi:hypothetical protein
MDIAEIAQDRARIEQGAWIDEIPEMGELRLRVRGTENADYKRMLQKLTAAIPRNKRQGGRIDPVELDKVLGSCAHATLLLDWDGVIVNEERKPYDKELAFRLCTEPRYRRFMQAVLWAASEVDNTNAEAEAEAAGN